VYVLKIHFLNQINCFMELFIIYMILIFGKWIKTILKNVDLGLFNAIFSLNNIGADIIFNNYIVYNISDKL